MNRDEGISIALSLSLSSLFCVNSTQISKLALKLNTRNVCRTLKLNRCQVSSHTHHHPEHNAAIERVCVFGPREWQKSYFSRYAFADDSTIRVQLNCPGFK